MTMMSRSTFAVLGLLAACATGPRGPGDAVMLADGARLAEPRDPRYEPTLPRRYDRPGKRYEGHFRVCVSKGGEVSQITTTRSTGVSEIDQAWLMAIRMWPYRLHAVDGQAQPFCHPLVLAVKGKERPKLGEEPIGAMAVSLEVARSLQKPGSGPSAGLPLPAGSPVGTRMRAHYKLCADAGGKIVHVASIEPADLAVNDQWMRSIAGWAHLPHVMEGVAHAYCYRLWVMSVLDGLATPASPAEQETP